jgi:NAD(P)H dehydrogenase (quinone)
VRAVVRESSNTDDLRATGCEIAVADFRDAAAVRKAIEGARGVQVICPVSSRAKDAASDMANIIDGIATALSETRPWAKYRDARSPLASCPSRSGFPL